MRRYQNIHNGQIIVRAAKIQDPKTIITTKMLADGAHGRKKPIAGDYLLDAPGRSRRVVDGAWFELNFDPVDESSLSMESRVRAEVSYKISK